MVRDEQGSGTRHGTAHPNDDVLPDAQARKEPTQYRPQIIQSARAARLIHGTSDQLQFHRKSPGAITQGKSQDEVNQPCQCDNNPKGTQA